MNLKKGRCLENECFCENDNDVVEPTVVFFQEFVPKWLYDSNKGPSKDFSIEGTVVPGVLLCSK